MPDPATVAVIAPNWLGDAVMSLPAIFDVRRRFSSARLLIAARRAVADVFRLVPGVDDVVTLEWNGRWWQRGVLAGDAARLRALDVDAVLLLPNSFATAWLARRAAIPIRWGYASDMRGALLTQAVPRPRRSLHQGANYQHLTHALGIDSGPLEPALTVSETLVDGARVRLRERGWDETRRLIVFAPGAAYGTAKRWRLPYVARVMSTLIRERGVTCVMVGGRGDASAARTVLDAVDVSARPHVVDLTGRTTIGDLAGVLTIAAACVANDSGAMHVAAAIGTPVIALFGPTREYETAPLTRRSGHAEVLTHPVWCRPCMLRECPIDHRCMKGITPERVYGALTALLSSTS
jgi:heptosyltransferase-2